LTGSGGIFDLPRKAARLRELESLAGEPGFWEQQEKAQTQLKEMNRLKAEQTAMLQIEQALKDAKDLAELAEPSDDAVWNDLENTVTGLTTQIKTLDRETKFTDAADKDDALLTIHAGAGGTESCDWAEMLMRMYERYAERKGFTTEVTDMQQGDQTGIKSITFFIRGTYAYGTLKSEAGVHRLVRISPFDANKRRHTSFASCDVLPDVNDDIDIKIEDKDLRIDTYRAHGAGGQHINKTDSAIRITHFPSGLVVACQNQRSQIKNREKAMQILKIRLYELELDKRRQSVEKRYDEKGDMAWGNQIRSYVFMPYQMVKDHRTDFESSQVDKVMDGDIDTFVDAYLEYQAQAKLKTGTSNG
jgi:peptide chain release factor 2